MQPFKNRYETVISGRDFLFCQIDDLEEAYRDDISRIKWEVIREWKQRNANPPIRQLYYALKDNGRADVAQVLYDEALKCMY